MKTICICGGGSLSHVIAGFVSAKQHATVNVLTRKPEHWQHTLEIDTPDGELLHGNLNKISNDPAEVITPADIVLLCLPGFAIKDELIKIKPYVTKGTYVGAVFSSTGFFFEAMKLYDEDIHLWGFQRVPFISRVETYGKKAHLLGYKPNYNIAVEHATAEEKEDFRTTIEMMFERPVKLLNNYYEASFTNSNPILHPSRLYSLFKDWHEGCYFEKNYGFYAEWTDEASNYLIQMDHELFGMLKKLPVDPNFLMPILEYYESTDASSLSRKIRSIESFKTIKSPMKETEKGWVPDFDSRYFQEDFAYGLKYIYEQAHELNVETPMVDEIYHWGIQYLKK